MWTSCGKKFSKHYNINNVESKTSLSIGYIISIFLISYIKTKVLYIFHIPTATAATINILYIYLYNKIITSYSLIH